MLPEAAADARVLLETARAVLVAATDPSIPLTVPAIAMAAGMTEDAVVDALNSVEFLSALSREFHVTTGLALRRSVDTMRTMVEEKGRYAVPAFRALIEAHQAFSVHQDPDDPANSAERRFATLLEGLRSRSTARKIHAGSGRPSDSPSPDEDPKD